VFLVIGFDGNEINPLLFMFCVKRFDCFDCFVILAVKINGGGGGLGIMGRVRNSKNEEGYFFLLEKKR